MSETQLQIKIPNWLAAATDEVDKEVMRVREDAINKFKMVFDIEGDVTAIPTKNVPYAMISREFTVTVNNIIKYKITVMNYAYGSWRLVQFNEDDWSDLSILLAKKIANVLGGDIFTFKDEDKYILAVRKEIEGDTYYIVVDTKYIE